jgi:hypothetical protein
MSLLAGRLAQRHAHAEPIAPEALLGPGHPLARALEARRREAERVIAATAILVGAGTAGVVTAAPEPSLLIAAAIAMVTFGCRLALVFEKVRLEARQAIIDGRHRLPLECVRAERDRLTDARLHTHLAAWVRGLTCGAEGSAALPVWSVGAVRAVRTELREVALLLEAGHAGIRGVAMLEHLLTSGVLPLYGDDPRALAEELGRIRYHLCARI